MSGLKLQEELVRAEVHIPIIFLTAHGDIHMAVTAMKAGAVDFLTKPFRNQDVLDAVYAALELDGTRRKKEQSSSTLRERFESLSPRERDVVTRVAAGELNKQIAAELGLSEVTVKVHRAKAMRKMHAKSLAELVRMTDFVQARVNGSTHRPPHTLSAGRSLRASLSPGEAPRRIIPSARQYRERCFRRRKD